ncbi:MAG: hypothetical protein AB1894_28900 [Chloroflexota bacterium]
MERFFSIETRSGQPISYQGGTLTLFSQVVQLRIPGLPGGLCWNRPVSVLFQDSQGEEHVLSIQDTTRLIVLALLGAAAFTWLWRQLRN